MNKKDKLRQDLLEFLVDFDNIPDDDDLILIKLLDILREFLDVATIDKVFCWKYIVDGRNGYFQQKITVEDLDIEKKFPKSSYKILIEQEEQPK